MAVVAVNGLERRYGSFHALKGVSFTIEPGEIVGLLGPNGAGKSTTMKIMTGFLAPTGGTATVCGHDVLTAPLEVRRQIGYLPEAAPIYGDMTVDGYLQFIGRARGLGAAERTRAIERVTDECGLTGRARQLVSTLSRGYRQRVGLAQALLHEPRLLILDEPTTGLDPNQIVEIREIIRRVGETRTVILSTHILPEVQVTCDRVLIIHDGKLVADGTTDDVMGEASGHQVSVGVQAGKVQAADAELIDQLAAIAGVHKVQLAPPGESTQRFTIMAGSDVRADLFRWAVTRGHTLVELTSHRTNLEEVFRRLTSGGTA
jgi:ABC-2 type transport system ATP-binding protein